MKADRQAPIGVFDSGVGGLTVVREIMRNLPDERIVYFGDTARVPYGSKSKNTVIPARSYTFWKPSRSRQSSSPATPQVRWHSIRSKKRLISRSSAW